MNSRDHTGLTPLDRAVLDFDRMLRRTHVIPRPACDGPSLDQRERVLGRALPTELRAVYGRFDGVDVGAMGLTTRAIRIWPLGELWIAGTAEAGAFGDCIVFADFLLSSIEYGYCLTVNGIVSLDGAESRLVADGLYAFLVKCLADDPSLY